MKVLTVLGARPQFIKASAVSAVLASSSGMSEVLVHTGQHFDANMSEVFFNELGLPAPGYNLDVHGGRHGEMTGRMLEKVERVLLDEKPNVVLVYGDTNSTLAGALAAAKLSIPVAHVEAGLRSFNMRMPEEVNRVLTDRLSRWLFTPTAAAVAHLQSEGVSPEAIFPVGDVMFDVALRMGRLVDARGGLLQKLSLESGSYALVTIHRAENTDDRHRLEAIVDAIVSLAHEISVIWPLHPRAKVAFQRYNLLQRLSSAQGLQMIDPVGYLEMIQLEKYAAVIVTDSGGVQKEAYFYEVPCVTLRDETEWVELIAAGWNRLSPPMASNSILADILSAVGVRGRKITEYGDGNAAGKIVNYLRQ